MTDLQDRLNEAYRLSGQARYAAFDAVLRQADADGEDEFAYRTRLGLIEQFTNSGEFARGFLAFTSCLPVFDGRPELVRSGDERTLLWSYKWIVDGMPSFSTVPLDRARALMDDMERRYRAGGHSLHAVYERRGRVALHLGDLDAAGHWYAEMSTARRDGLSSCAACVPMSVVMYHAARGDDEEAVRVGDPHLSGGCANQPQNLLAYLLLPYLRSGRLAEAANAHRTAYPRQRDDRDDLGLIAMHVEFCALSGNEDHGLAIVERHLPWLDRPCSELAAMRFASSAALLLRRLRDTGHGDDRVRRRTDRGDRQWTATVADTYAEMAALARTLAAKFDARNENDYQSGQVERRIAAEPVVARLPLTVLQGRPLIAYPGKERIDELVARVAQLTVAADAPAAARARLDIAYQLRNAAQWADATETAEEALRSLQQAGLTDEALAARHLLVELYRRDWRRRDTAYTLLGELLDAASLPDGLPSRAALLEEAAVLTHGPAAAAHLLAAADLYRASADAPGEARSLRNTRGHGPIADHTIARLDALTGSLRGDDLLDTQEMLCNHDAAAGRHGAALDRARRYPGNHAGLRNSEINSLLALNRPVEAEERARELVAADRANWWPKMLVAKALLAQDRRPDAEAFLTEHDIDPSELDELDEMDELGD
ncbi:hypothetical protein ODJ79_30265 [Actinoplanes sp. KI2]|uniref:hypothetical protein n=1 Tax=Actinoplanes sp. KI2 TaxID=2983315 RepID=UPI0021D5EC98|nr:hypothetical protein [Actinoplanes sp. KI2]MCU7728024.1 hypothetical protein [Actinoplanes sp. KI2]